MHSLTLLSTTIILTLSSLTTAKPISNSPSSCPPIPSASLGFRLRVNVTDTSKDTTTPPLQGTYLTLAHIGPAQNRAIVTPTPGPIFYQNGTYADIANQRVNVLTDAGTPLFPEGLAYLPDPSGDDSKGQGLYAFGGSGNGGIRLTRLWEPESYLTILEDVVTSTLVVCPGQTIPYYGAGRTFDVVNWVQATRDASGTRVVVPEGCVGVRLVPECAVLEELPEGAISSHEFAQEVRCYN